MSDRFEPIPRDTGVDGGLAAQVHDPLWLLSRQWQFGEFRGEDSGSIVGVQVELDTHRLDRWRGGGETEWRPFHPGTEPLERLVEAEPEDPVDDPRLRAEGGVRLGRMLADADLGPAPWIRLYGFLAPQAERAARGLPALIRARVADGARAAAGLRRLLDPATSGAEAGALELSGTERARAGDLARRWLEWWDERAARRVPARPVADDPGARPPAWDDHRMEYAFAVGAGGAPDLELRAVEYHGGRLEWWSMDAGAPEGGGGTAAPERLTLRGVPGPAAYGGMPASRFWEMEDARIDFGSVDAAPHDLGRLLMISYATVYGNDWYVVPVRLPIGTLCRVRTFTVTNVFGEQEPVAPAGADSPDFHLFRPADTREPSGVSPWFLLAPALAGSLEGPAVESVVLARDEMANLAWAVEQRIEDVAGLPYDRRDAMTRPPRPPQPPPSAMPAYRVDTPVPDFWYPLAPQRAEGESIRLRLRPFLGHDVGQDGVLPLGVLLAGADAEGSWLHEEEVPRSGVALSRSRQRARWHDGSVHDWTARRKGSGAGESSSGLRFDTVEQPGPAS